MSKLTNSSANCIACILQEFVDELNRAHAPGSPQVSHEIILHVLQEGGILSKCEVLEIESNHDGLSFRDEKEASQIMKAVFSDQIHLSECDLIDLGNQGCELKHNNKVVSRDNVAPNCNISHLEFIWHNFFHREFNEPWHTVETLLILRQARRENTVNNRNIEEFLEFPTLTNVLDWLKKSVELDKNHHGVDTIGLHRFIEIVNPFIPQKPNA